jgi:NitT/TauT family transport system ATP-binding protein
MGVELLRIWQAYRQSVVFGTHSIREAAFLSDRVLVMGARPATIIGPMNIDLPRPRPIAITEDEAFNCYVRLLQDGPLVHGLALADLLEDPHP